MAIPRARFAIAPLLALLAPGTAAADDGWMATAEAPAAVAVSNPQSDWFGAGTMPSAALYRSFGARLLAGVRLRAGFLTSRGVDTGEADGKPLDDKRTGGLGSLTVGGRLRPRGGAGPWVEAGAGGALTGHDLRPTAELAIGWGFEAGPVDVGPSLRYLHVFQPDDELSPADARIALIGLEVTLGGHRADRLPLPERPPGRPRVRGGAPAFAADRDPEHLVDLDAPCPLHEVPGGDPQLAPGCPRHALFTIVEDRIALEERVLFDTGRARVRHGGRVVLAAVAAHLEDHPEFERVEIEGHADDRGTDSYNLLLSAARAERVRDVLVGLGVGASLRAAGFGEDRPRQTGHGERAWRVNRRVELVLVRRREVPVDATTRSARAEVER
ncbi:MAG TPA: OmpA family protein [Kofleriaceae bacterium]|nr:OmpA family protein [Kofleriaceae bacterium]